MEHNTNDNFITDEQLLVLLEHKEAGKSFPAALAVISTTPFSLDETRMLKSLWDMHGDLTREAHTLSPERALLSRIIAHAGATSGDTVTTSPSLGYTEYSAKGHFISLNNNLHSIMQMNWKIAAPIAVVVIVAGIVMSSGGKEAEHLAVNNAEITQEAVVGEQAVTMAASNDTSAAMAMKAAAPAPVSGNVNDLMASLMSEGAGDLMLIDGSAEDAALVKADSQSVNDFTTAYDETTF